MKPGYAQVAWGIALELIDFRIQFFDVFPDAIGYILIIAGLSKLPQNRRFKTGRIAAGVLLILSIPHLIGPQPGITLNDSASYSAVTLLMSTIETAVEMTMMYGICGGIREHALKSGLRQLADSARTVWSWIFALGGTWVFFTPFLWNVRNAEWNIFIIVLGLGMFAANVSVIFLVRRAGRGPGGGRSDGETARMMAA